MSKILNFFIFTIICHIGVLFISFSAENDTQKDNHRINIVKIRPFGEEVGRVTKSAYIKPKKKITRKRKSKSKLKSLSQLSTRTYGNSRVNKKNILPKKASTKIRLANQSIKDFVKGSSNRSQARAYLQALGNTDTQIRMEVPKGIKESELNKHELVFYSFQQRTAEKYLNSFYQEINEFEITNPHLKFPMTKKSQKLTGRVVYDKHGNILKMQFVKWSNNKKLQSFFESVLKRMVSLPNPPKEIVYNEQFTIYYSFNINL